MEESYELYKRFCNVDLNDEQEIFMKKMRIVNRICDEIVEKPVRVENSSFICEVKNCLKTCFEDKKNYNVNCPILANDAYLILSNIIYVIENKTDVAELTKDEKDLFKSCYKSEAYGWQRQCNEIQEKLKKLENIIQKEYGVVSEEKESDVKIIQKEPVVVSEEKQEEVEADVKIIQKEPVVVLEEKQEEQKKDVKEISKEPVIVLAEKKKESKIQKNEKKENDVLAIEREITERTMKRVKENQVSVQAWHDEQTGVISQIREMQPTVKKLYEEFLTFSDKIIEQYVLQFAKKQIELFNSLMESYSFHKPNAEKMGNRDYLNAANNYQECCYDICDALACFGVEEITSVPGDKFNGHIHEAEKNNGFSNRTAVIQESIRTGFKYHDNVLQKEIVKVK